MKEMKRILSLVLCLAMLVGMLPMFALKAEAATGNVIDAAIFCSDVHGRSDAVSSAFSGIKNADSTFSPSTATFVGDTQMAASSVTSAAQSVYSDVACYYAYGNHDSEGDYGINDVTGLLYSGDNYYVYAISQTSMASPDPDTTGFTSTVAGLDKTKPLFIASHLPLHNRRGDSHGAAAWYAAISAAAESMDIVFFWAHNHTGENDVDRAAFYVAKDGTETFTLENTSTEVTPNFTYMNAGFVGQGSNRGGVVTTVKIYSDALVFQDYTSSGDFMGEYSHNVEVTREFASTTDSGDGGSGDSGESGDDDTTGGSTDTVVGDATVSTAPDGSWQTVTFGTEGEQKTVYVLVSTPTAGKNYIIASGSSGSVYALKENTTTGTSVTVNAATGSITAPYIENSDKSIVWTASSGMNFKSVNGGYYLNYSESNSSYKVSFSKSSASDWTAGTNALYREGKQNDYYLRYNSDWTMGGKNTEYNVYFYEEQTIDTSSSVTYSVTASDIEHFYTADETDTETVTIEKSVTTGTPDGTFAYAIVGGDDIIASIDQSTGTITFNGNKGTAQVKASYTWTDGENEYTIFKVINVTAAEPTYVLDITADGAVVTGTTIAKKGVTASTTLQLGTKIQFVDADGAETVELPQGATIEWHIPEEYHSIATVGQDTGLISFKGVDGAFYVTATLSVGGKDITVGVNISATTSSYSVPSDGATDFPEYPNEGAIRFDKTATAVGNFSQTGIAQLELSMTGVPYTTGSELDVVIMLDQSTSMDSNRISATVAATKAFIKSIVINEDGTYNDNRIYVGYFNGDKTYDITDSDNIGGDLATIDSKTELDALFADIDDEFDGSPSSTGTNYAVSLKKCYDRLNTAKTDGVGNDRQQFCVFMSDGVPTDYQSAASTTIETSAIQAMFTGTSYNTRDTDYKYEYYSSQMKANDVTVYTVGLGLNAKNNAWNSASATQCLNAASILLNDISGSAGETTQPDALSTTTLSKKDQYFFSVEDATAAADMKDVFEHIAMKILQAATDVTVEDQITDAYTMIFDIPTGDKTITGVENDFYIEFGKYALDEDHERTTFTSVTKLYLTNTNGVLSAKDSTAPVFEQKTIGDKGTLYYWSTNAADGDAGISVTVSGTTYYFVSYGMEEAGYNMTSGAYANGKVDSDTNMSTDLIIATPNFVYNAATKMIYWTVDKLDTTEYVLRYFLYLDDSATEVGTDKETDPGSYLTNDHAYITYTNFLGHDCRQEFPKPQLTWNGAQVSYVFYLVNAAGQPINKSGQVVDFANATFITDIFTTAVVWNKDGDTSTGTGQLSADWLAHELLPDEYEIYDEQARYVLNVYENADGSAIKNQFTISGGTAAEISASLNSRLKLATTTASISTTKVYNTKAGQKISAYGTYTSADSDMKDIDFANTTVAFAVVWQPRLVEDTVVVDYGLDVIINVVENDILQNKVTGIGVGTAAYGNTAMNTGVSTTSKLGTAALEIDGNTISIENETSIRFHQGDMQFNAPVVFYYETPVEFWEGSDPTEGYMYSSVTVIPATTIYYEDSFVEFSSYTLGDAGWKPDAGEYGRWFVDGTQLDGVQAQDRPGESQISAVLDADNNYGFDAAYQGMSTYSMGSARKITVSPGIEGWADFEFYGTGFDVIATTTNTSGTIIVEVYTVDANGNLSNPVKSFTVDTYYGFQYDADEDKWTPVDSNDPAALYQVPVMKIAGLPYADANGKPIKYHASVLAFYGDLFDHTGDGQYEFALDAIRIYDPANNGKNDQKVEDAYVADGEGWPTYEEVRNYVITANTFESVGTEDVNGIVFIDSNDENAEISDYTSFGPNNELYLAPGQAITFNLNAGANVAKIQMALKTVTGSADVEVYTVVDAAKGKVLLDQTIDTATDMYYTLWQTGDENNTQAPEMTLVIKNTGDAGILSITNVKVTHTAEPAAPRMMMFSVRRSTVDDALATMNVVEEPVVPETDPTVPSEPETEPSESETEPTVPETKPEKPDFDELKKAVEKAKKLKEKDYTKESFKDLKDAQKAAEKVLKDKKATQEDIDEALEELNEALNNLEAKADKKPGKPDPKEIVETIIEELIGLIGGWLGNRN